MLAIAIVLAGVAFVVLWRELSAKNRPKKVSKLAAGAAGVLLAMLLFLTATGRLPWLAALLAGALPFVRWIAGLFIAPLIGNLFRSGLGAFGRRPFFGAGGGAAGATTGGPQASTVATADLDMTLDHQSGQMDGTVLTGSYAGRRLSELDRAALQGLYDELAADDSRQLLAAYLERRFADWGGADGGDGPKSHDGGQEMSPNQALAVLGLAADASEKEVVAAHRRLMQKLHPDRGGTTYLAATLNRAKEVLLKR